MSTVVSAKPLSQWWKRRESFLTPFSYRAKSAPKDCFQHLGLNAEKSTGTGSTMSIFDRFWKTPKKDVPPPRTPAVVSPTSGGAFVERRSRARKDALRGVKALIIDDSATVVAALRKILRSAGFSTREAADAEQGLALIALDMPDLIFLDIILPGMNGFSALRSIRRDPVTQHIPVIMISGNEHATEQFYANRIGADDFMKKPFSRYEVFARIESLLDAQRKPRRKAVAGQMHNEVPSHLIPLEPSLPTSAHELSPQPPVPVSSTVNAAPTSRFTAIEARKELTAMGLQYFDQLQFFSAIRRGDLLAVELFVVSGGVRLDEPLEGKTALGLAKELGKPEITRLLLRKAIASNVA